MSKQKVSRFEDIQDPYLAATCKVKVFIVFRELYNGHDIHRTTNRVFAIEAAAQHYIEVMSELNTNVDVEYCLEEWEIE